MKTIHLLCSLLAVVFLTIVLGGVEPPPPSVQAESNHTEAVEQEQKLEMPQTTSSTQKPVKPAQKKPQHRKAACDYIDDYDWDKKLVRAIAMAESGCRADAKGDTTLTFAENGRVYGYSLGVLQVRILPGREACDTFNAELNIKCAYGIYQRQGYGAWTMYNNGGYVRFYQ